MDMREARADECVVMVAAQNNMTQPTASTPLLIVVVVVAYLIVLLPCLPLCRLASPAARGEWRCKAAAATVRADGQQQYRRATNDGVRAEG